MSRPLSWVRRQVAPIGLDLGRRCIRLLQIAQQRGGISVVAAAEQALPPGVQSGTEYERMAVETVRRMLAGGGFSGTDVVTHLPWDALQVRSLRVPSMPLEEIGEVIRFEAAERLGLDPANTEARFIVAGDVRQGTEVRQEVIVLAATRPDVQAHVSLLARMGLQPVAIEAGPCAVFRGFERFLKREEDRETVNAFADIGYAATRLIISRGRDIIFFKSMPIGGQRFDELVSEHLELSLVEAADLRTRLHRQTVAALTGQSVSPDEMVGENVRRAVLDALRPAVEHLSKEIGLCLRYCSVSFRGLRSDAVTVVGGEACNADVVRMLSDQVNAPFHLGKALRNIGSDGDFGGVDRRTGQPEWATALGLALKPVGSMQEAAA